MTVHFALAGREHELAYLRLRDIAEDPEGRGLIVDVRVSKVGLRDQPVARAVSGRRRQALTGHRWARDPKGTSTVRGAMGPRLQGHAPLPRRRRRLQENALLGVL
ncbi:hypothetical protein ACFQ7G_19575 [Streptomyces massasporeus]